MAYSNWTRVPRAEVDGAVAKILASKTFASMQRLKRLLEHLVAKACEGAPRDTFATKVLAVEVFNRKRRDFDGEDSHTRVYLNALRDALKTYASAEGQYGSVLILLDRQGKAERNVPRIEWNSLHGAPLDLDAQDAIARWCAIEKMRPFTADSSPQWQAVVDDLEGALGRFNGHPLLTSILAVIHIEAMLRGALAHESLKTAGMFLNGAIRNRAVNVFRFVAEAFLTGIGRREWGKANGLLKDSVLGDLRDNWLGLHVVAGGGNFAEGCDLIRRAMETRGLEGDLVFNLVRFSLCAGRYSDAGVALDWLRGLTADPLIYEYDGWLAEATGDTNRLVDAARHMGKSGVCFRALAGERDEAELLYADLQRHPEDRCGKLGLLALSLGRDEEAVQWLWRACLNEYDSITFWINGMPIFRRLLHRPDFRRLLEKLGMPLRV